MNIQYINNDIKKKVFRIDCCTDENKKETKFGTAFLAASNIIITAYHTVENYIKEVGDYKYIFIEYEFKNPVLLFGPNNKDNKIEYDEELDIAVIILKNNLSLKHFCLAKFGDESFPNIHAQTYGFPSIDSHDEGTPLDLTIIQANLKSEKYDLELKENYRDFDQYNGFSGAPIIIQNNVVGFLNYESHLGDRLLGRSFSKIEKFFNDKKLDIKMEPFPLDRRVLNYLDKKSKEEKPEEKVNTILPYPENSFYVDREDIPLEKLNQEIRECKYIALSGLGGNGKTQLASQYAHKYKKNFNAVFWVNSENSKDIRNNFANLVTKIPNIKTAYSKSENIKLVISWIKNKGNILLIFDNITTGTLKIFRDEFMINLDGSYILLTTQIKETGLIKNIKVKEFSEQDALSLFIKRSQLENISESLSSELMKKLGFHPLAIEQAASFIRKTGKSIEEYLESWRQLLLSDKEGSENHIRSIKKTFMLCNDVLIQEKRISSIEFLFMCSFLHPDSIPEYIFIGNSKHLPLFLKREINKSGIDLVIESLTEFSLVERNKGVIIIHRLVQEVIRDSLKENVLSFFEYLSFILEMVIEKSYLQHFLMGLFARIYIKFQKRLFWFLRMVNIINNSFPDFSDQIITKEKIFKAESFFPSSTYIMEIGREEEYYYNNKSIGSLLESIDSKIQNYISILEDREEKIQKWEQIIKIDPNNVDALTGLGKEYYNLQLYSLSLEKLKKSISINPNQYDVVYLIGRIYLIIKRYKKSYSEFRKLSKLKDYKNIDSNYFYYYAVSAYKFGRLTIASDYLKKSIEINQLDWKSLFLNAKIIIESRKGINSVENINTAIQNLENCLELNPDNADVYILLSKAYLITGNRTKSKKYLDIGKLRNKAIEKLMKFANVEYKHEFYEDSIQTISSYLDKKSDNAVAFLNRCIYYIKRGEYDKAKKDLEKSIELKSNLPIHLYLMGYIEYRNHRNEQAISLLSEYLKTGDSSELINSCKYIAASYRNIGDYNNAIVYLKKAINEMKKIQNSVPGIYIMLAACMEKNNDQKNALKQYKNAFRVYKSKINELGLNNQFLQVTYKLLVYERFRGNMKECKKYMKIILEAPDEFKTIKEKLKGYQIKWNLFL